MTIDEAIRYNEVTLDEMERQLLHHRASALRLSIEALKRCKNFRDNSITFGYDPLPSETKNEGLRRV